MREMGLAGMAPGPNTSRSHPQHKVYPYLLRGVAVVKPNQVWSTDITLYLMGVASRYRHTRRGQHGYPQGLQHDGRAADRLDAVFRLLQR